VAKKNSLFTTEWVHVHEEDTADGAVFKPATASIPLSRRPRERLSLDANGGARLFVQGADDRYAEQPANWKDEKGAVVVRTSTGDRVLRIVEQSADRLIVKMPGGASR
jgi:hypothetical protein